MTSATMLAKVRTLLDEASAGLWSDSEIYEALTEGQLAVAQYLLNLFKKTREFKPGLRGLLKEQQGATNSGYISYGDATADIPDFWDFFSLRIDNDSSGTEYEARILTRDEYFQDYESGGYWQATKGSPIAYVYVSSTTPLNRIIFLPSPATTATYTLEYFKKPTDISSSIEPILGEETHPAIVQYAFADVLRKDELITQSQAEFNKFYEMLKWI